MRGQPGRTAYAKRGGEKLPIAERDCPAVEAEDLLVHSRRWWGKESLRASAGWVCHIPRAPRVYGVLNYEMSLSD